MILKEVEHKLPSNFMRIQRKYIVNRDHVTGIFNEDSKVYASMENGVTLPVGRTYVKVFREFVSGKAK